MYAAIAATPMLIVAALRMPAMMPGAASGSARRSTICCSVIPIPRAASIDASGIERSATYVFLRIGSSA